MVGLRVILAVMVATAGLAGCAEDSCVLYEDDVTDCYNGYCDGDGSGNAFCACWDQGKDLHLTTCDCVTLDLLGTCEDLGLEDYETGDFDCAASCDVLDHTCVVS